ncbi:MAG: SDR family NAD(P)-dependent oxidoreductase, partial [bacterium]|nr:SDR family NAD(P)-dependent oxidoreductase [bacterium]
MFSLEGRTALLTGGAGGLGRAMATALAEQGASVAISDLRPEAASAIAGELAERHPAQAFTGLAMDVTDEASVMAGVSEATKAVGSPD